MEPVIALDEAEARYEALRERDRTIASLQSKQRMVAVFEHVLDDPARDHVRGRLLEALQQVRDEARKLALELTRSVLVEELGITDLGRVGWSLRRLEEYLDAEPSERLDTCHDLITFLRELRETAGAPRRLQVIDIDP
jgi:hypothetical protein